MKRIVYDRSIIGAAFFCAGVVDWGDALDTETELYYLQTRYYAPENVRFLNADIYVSTGHGLLDSNMFAYCWNNPVIRSDATGTDPLAQASADDLNPLDDYDNFGRLPSGGGNTWGSFVRTLQSAADGLKMALGQRNTLRTEKHHLYSNKNKTYTPLYRDVMDRYNISLNNSANIVALVGHSGRHTNVYHEFMLNALYDIDATAGGDVKLFKEGLIILKHFLVENPGLPYAK